MAQSAWGVWCQGLWSIWPMIALWDVDFPELVEGKIYGTHDFRSSRFSLTNSGKSGSHWASSSPFKWQSYRNEWEWFWYGWTIQPDASESALTWLVGLSVSMFRHVLSPDRLVKGLPWEEWVKGFLVQSSTELVKASSKPCHVILGSKGWRSVSQSFAVHTPTLAQDLVTLVCRGRCKRPMMRIMRWLDLWLL